MARDLKYRSVDTDFASLERELRGESHGSERDSEAIPDNYADLAEEYGAYVDDDEDDDEA